MTLRLKPLWLTIGWAIIAGIVWLSLTPAPPDIDIAHGDKLGHLLGYGLLSAWFCQIYTQRRTRLRWASAFIAMGIGLEIVQGALGYRMYEVADMVANSAGVLLGWATGAVLGSRLLLGIETLVLATRNP